jgi:hypothetical protein
MPRLFETVTDLAQGAGVLRRRRYGVIEVAEGRLVGVHLRPWPKLVCLAGAAWLNDWLRRSTPSDRCWLYYNHPRTAPDYLSLMYVVSNRGGTLASLRGAARVLEEIARLKGSHAIVCEVRNARISERLLARWGWERHVAGSRRRHFIRRFYGHFPPPAPARLCSAGGGNCPAN